MINGLVIQINSNKFKKFSALEHTKNNKGQLILWKYEHFVMYTKDKMSPVETEYFIWSSNAMISRGRKSLYYYIAGTFHRPKPYSQLLIILFKDIIIKEKIPLFFILMSNRREDLYKRIFNSVIEILTQNYIYNLPVISITTDTELGLINAVESTFIGVQSIGCFYHLKDNLVNFAKMIGLLNKNNQYVKIEETNDVIYRLGNLCVEYDGNIDYFDD